MDAASASPQVRLIQVVRLWTRLEVAILPRYVVERGGITLGQAGGTGTETFAAAGLG